MGAVTTFAYLMTFKQKAAAEKLAGTMMEGVTTLVNMFEVEGPLGDFLKIALKFIVDAARQVKKMLTYDTGKMSELGLYQATTAKKSAQRVHISITGEE